MLREEAGFSKSEYLRLRGKLTGAAGSQTATKQSKTPGGPSWTHKSGGQHQCLPMLAPVLLNQWATYLDWEAVTGSQIDTFLEQPGGTKVVQNIPGRGAGVGSFAGADQ